MSGPLGPPVSGPLGPVDSGGMPWSGRAPASTGFDADTGAADPRLVAALERSRAAPSADHDLELMELVTEARWIVPVVAAPGETGEGDGRVVETTTEMAVVTLTAPDGQRALPVFTGSAALAAWDPVARPVPVTAARAAQAAVAEGCAVVVVDVADEHACELRPSMVWALAQDRDWVPAHRDPFVARSVSAALEPEPDVVWHELGEGDTPGSGVLRVVLGLRPGLDQGGVEALATRVGGRLATDGELRARVDGLAFALAPAGGTPASKMYGTCDL